MKKFLKVYLPFTSNQLKRNMAYKGAFYLFIFCSMFSSFVSYYLWMAIYGSSASGVIGGLSQGEMVIYIFMSYITSSVVMIGIGESISEDVVKGTISMNLIKPINYRISLIFAAFGEAFYRFMAPCVFVWIGVECYRVFKLGIGLTPIVNVLLYILSVSLSFFIYVLFDYCFGMIAFFTTYIFGLNMAKDALLSFLTGQLIPLSFFPVVVQRVFDFLPFSSMLYTPVMIYLGKYTGGELAFVLGRQLVWVVLLYGLGSLLWKQVTRRLVVLGG